MLSTNHMSNHTKIEPKASAFQSNHSVAALQEVIISCHHLQSSLDLEASRDQVELLNPTPRHVKMAAIIDQCTSMKARRVIAKPHIECISSNVNSYARILYGSQQCEQIKTFNDILASISALPQEREESDRKLLEGG